MFNSYAPDTMVLLIADDLRNKRYKIPGPLPQYHHQSNAMAHLQHPNLVSMKLCPFNFFFPIRVQLRNILFWKSKGSMYFRYVYT